MSRPRQHRRDLPTRVYHKHGSYWFVATDRKWHKLGNDYPEAMGAYARLLQGAVKPCLTVSDLLDKYYRKVVLPTHGASSQQGALTAFKFLRGTFGHLRFDELKPHHIRAYMHQRPKAAANRDRTHLMGAYRHAIETGSLGESSYNPARDVKEHKLKARTRYVSWEEFWAVHDTCPPEIQCAMELATVSGLRIGDVVALTKHNLTDDGILVRTQKTGKELCIAWTDDLREVVARCRKLGNGTRSLYLLCDERGQPFTAKNLGKRFGQALLPEGRGEGRFRAVPLPRPAGQGDQRLEELQARGAHERDAGASRVRPQRDGGAAQSPREVRRIS